MDYLALLVFAIIFLGGILPSRCGPGYTFLWTLLAGLASYKFQLVYLIFGDPQYSIPNIPGWCIAGMGWLYAVALFFAFLLPIFWILYAIGAAGAALLGRDWGTLFHSIRLWGVVGSLALAMLIASVGLYLGTALPEVKERKCEITWKEEKREPMTVAVLSDLHIDRLTDRKWVKALVDRVNQCQADMIVLLGDIVDGRTSYLKESVEELKNLKAKWGVYSISGNHEYYSQLKEWLPLYSSWGISFLLNQNVRLPNGIYLAGITDPASCEERLEGPSLNKALAGIPVSSPVILLSHRPAYADLSARRGVDLQISGHTHGGSLWGVDQVVAKANGGYVRGFYSIGNLTLFVSPGTSLWNGFPIRLGISSEITLLQIK